MIWRRWCSPGGSPRSCTLRANDGRCLNPRSRPMAHEYGGQGRIGPKCRKSCERVGAGAGADHLMSAPHGVVRWLCCWLRVGVLESGSGAPTLDPMPATV